MTLMNLTKDYNVSECYLGTLHYLIGNESKNDIYLIDNKSDISKYFDGDCKKFRMFSICVMDKPKGEEGLSCVINIDTLKGATHAFKYDEFGENLTANQKLSILLSARFIDALFRTHSGKKSGLHIKTCMARVKTLYDLDISSHDNKIVLNAIKEDEKYIKSLTTLYDVNIEYLEDIAKQAKSLKHIYLVDDTNKKCVINGVEIEPLWDTDALKTAYINNTRYYFINLSLLDRFVDYADNKCIRTFVKNVMDIDLSSLESKETIEKVRVLFKLYSIIHVIHRPVIKQHVVLPQESIDTYIKTFILHEYALNTDEIINCITLKK